MAITEIEKQENIGTETDKTTQEQRMFTQEEVDKMMQSRILKEQSRFSDYEELKAKASRFDEIEEANKSELQKANERADGLQSELDAIKKANTIRDIQTKVSTETGVPLHLLTAETEEACKQQAENILSFAKPAGYPTVRDGGETSAPNTKTKFDQFGDWFNEQINNQ